MINYVGRTGGLYTLYAESAQGRTEWRTKLEEALGARKGVAERERVFGLETLSLGSFPAAVVGQGVGDGVFTGKVTCSVPFSEWRFVRMGACVDPLGSYF